MQCSSAVLTMNWQEQKLFFLPTAESWSLQSWTERLRAEALWYSYFEIELGPLIFESTLVHSGVETFLKSTQKFLPCFSEKRQKDLGVISSGQQNLYLRNPDSIWPILGKIHVKRGPKKSNHDSQSHLVVDFPTPACRGDFRAILIQIYQTFLSRDFWAARNSSFNWPAIHKIAHCAKNFY